MNILTYLILLLAAGLGRTQEGAASIRTVRAEAIARTRGEIEALIEGFGGRDAIRDRLHALHEEVEALLEESAGKEAHTITVGGYDFSKHSTASAIKPVRWSRVLNTSRGEVSARNAILDFDRKLKRLGVDLIVIPVPSKIEAYGGLFGKEVPRGMPICLPRLEEMLFLLEHDVEVVDVLPTVSKLMTDDDALPLYETTGHHLSGFAVKHAGTLVTERLARYALDGADTGHFTEVKRLAYEGARPDVSMWVWEVLDQGRPYGQDARSEVIVIGDSNVKMYGGASWAAHIARGTGIAVADIANASGGSTAHLKLSRQGRGILKQRRVVIWILSATSMDLAPWYPAEISDQPGFFSLMTSGMIQEALALYNAPDFDRSSIRIEEAEMNDLAQGFLEEKQTKLALEVFRFNTQFFAHSATAFWNLGKACFELGQRREAVKSLKAALALNPSPSTRSRSLELLKTLGVEYTPPEPYRLKPDVAQAWVGAYSLNQGHKGIVTIEAGELLFELVGQPKMILRPLSDQLFTTDLGIKVEFTPAGNAGPVGVVLTAARMRLEGTRQ